MFRKTKIIFPVIISTGSMSLLTISCGVKWDLTWDYVKNQTTKHYISCFSDQDKPHDYVPVDRVTGFYFDLINKNNTIFTDDFFTYLDPLLSSVPPNKGNLAKASMTLNSIDTEHKTISFGFCIEENIKSDYDSSKYYYKLTIAWTNLEYEVLPKETEGEITSWILQPKALNDDWLLNNNNWKLKYGIKITDGEGTNQESGTINGTDFYDIDTVKYYASLSSLSLGYLDFIQTDNPVLSMFNI